MQDVVKAIRALYHGENPQQQQAADKWLVEFQKKPAAWAVGGQLLSAQDMELEYFGANMFALKVADEWNGLPQAQRDQLRNSIMSVFKQRALNPKAAAATTTRLAVTICEIAISEKKGVAALLQEIMPLAQSNMAIVMHVLRVLPDRIDRENLPLLVRKSGEADLRAARPAIFKLLASFMNARIKEANAKSYSQLQQALDCLLAFVPLGVTIVQMREEGLLDVCIATLRLNAVQHLAKVCDVLSRAIEINHYPREPGRDEAVAIVLRLVVGLRPIYDEAVRRGPAQDLLCKAICNLSSTLGEIEMDLVSLGSPPALKLVDLQLQCTKHSNNNVSLQSLEFFHALQDRAVNKRHPQLRQPVYVVLLQNLVAQVAYPANFTSWDSHSGDLDKDGFTRFREIMWETLLVIHSLLNVQYTELQLRALKTAGLTWHKKEAILFAVRVVAPEIKDLYRAATTPQDVKRILDAHLREIFAHAVAKDSHSSNPNVAQTVCSLIGSFSFWIASQTKLIQPLVLFLLQAARLTPQAGSSFQSVCKTCKPILAGNVQSLTSVLNNVYTQGQLEGVALEGKKKFVSGLAELVANLPAVADRQKGLEFLTNPILATIRGALSRAATATAGSSNLLQARDVVEQHLQLLALCINSQQYVQVVDENQPRGSENVQTVLPILHRNWKLIEETLKRWPSDPKVVEAQCQLFDSIFESLDCLSEPLLNIICTASVRLFHATHSAACLDVLISALQIFGSRPAAAVQFKAVVEATHQSLMTRDNGSSLRDPAVLAGFFSLCDNLFLRCRSAVLPGLAGLILLGARSLQSLSENKVCRTILVMLETMFGEEHMAAEEHKQINTAIASAGPRLIQSLFLGIASSLPSHLIKKVGSVIYTMMRRSAETTRKWVYQVLADPAFPSKRLTQSDKETFMKALWALRPQGQADTSRRFSAMVSDFSAVCRSNNTSECLLDYLLDPQKPISPPGRQRNNGFFA